jgi:predicted metal-binding membrane protein
MDGDRAVLNPAEAAIGAALVATSALAWFLAAHRMRGMDMGPGSDLGTIAFFVPTWAIMMTAMMLPSALAAVLRVGGSPRSAPAVGALSFTAGYLLVWLAIGLAVFAAYELLRELHPGLLAWNRGGALLAGGAVAAAALYELTPVKRRCLRRCRLSGTDAAASPSRAGLDHGLDCLGCSGGLMLVMLVLGPMSVVWMALVSVIVFAEKLAPRGMQLIPAFAAGLLALGVWIAIDPASVPGLTMPM